jgi:hypothetical protein
MKTLVTVVSVGITAVVCLIFVLSSNRQNPRSTTHQVAMQHKADAALAHRVADAEIADVEKVMDKLNAAEARSGNRQFFKRTGISGDGYHLIVTVDGDTWDELSTQDTSMLRQVLFGTFAKSYKKHHDTDAESPVVRIQNLAGDTLADDY